MDYKEQKLVRILVFMEASSLSRIIQTMEQSNSLRTITKTNWDFVSQLYLKTLL